MSLSSLLIQQILESQNFLKQNSNFNSIDFQLAQLLAEKETKPDLQASVFLLTLLLSIRLNKGAIFLDGIEFKEGCQKIITSLKEKIANFSILNFSQIAESQSVGGVNEKKPLIFDKAEDKIYFQKFYSYQVLFLEQIQRLYLKTKQDFPDGEALPKITKFLNQEKKLDKVQKEAIAKAFSFPLTIISGAPGTGKTFVIAKLLETIQKNSTTAKKIAFLSFTGKAASRLEESLNFLDLEQIDANHFRLGNIFLRISTIHSMLQSKHDYYYSEEEDLFLWDYLVLDETSMIDLALIGRLLSKTHPHSKVVLVGDHLQLHPIEVGYFFFDLCQALQSPKIKIRPFFFIPLQKGYRFESSTAEKKVSYLSKLLFKNNGAELLELAKLDKLKQDAKTEYFETRYFHSITEIPKLYDFLFQKIQDKYKALFQVTEPAQAFIIYRKFVILCGLRVGDWGLERINRWIEKKLAEKRTSPMEKELLPGGPDIAQPQIWYVGRPIMIQVNSPSLGVSNGDIGICLKDENGDYRIYFQGAEKISSLNPSSLPDYQSAFALSIHKSQGSEFDEVLICLAEKHYEHFNRELLYTAITRAKNKASIIATSDVLKTTVQKSCGQTTAIKEKIENMLLS